MPNNNLELTRKVKIQTYGKGEKYSSPRKQNEQRLRIRIYNFLGIEYFDWNIMKPFANV